MGDIRNCLISLAGEASILTSVCQHRFENPENFAGHSVGNLILSALYQMSGNFSTAVRQASELFRLTGQVLPATEVPVTLCALYENGIIAHGESDIPKPGTRISRVWLEPGDPVPAPGVIDALETADAVVIGPGSLYTSIIPNLLVGKVADAVRSSRAIKIFICNLMTQAGETDGYSAADHVRTLLDYLPSPSGRERRDSHAKREPDRAKPEAMADAPGEGLGIGLDLQPSPYPLSGGEGRSPIDVCVLNSSAVGRPVAERYRRLGSDLVTGDTEDEDQIRRNAVIPVAAPLLTDGEVKARHDPATLARLVVSLASGFARSHEIICSQGNGR
jgi:hypothetical protein